MPARSYMVSPQGGGPPTPPPPVTPGFPLLGVGSVGGSPRCVASVTYLNYAKNLNFVITGTWDGWQSSADSASGTSDGTNWSLARVTNYLHANSGWSTGTKHAAYFDHLYIISGEAAIPQRNAGNFWLRTSYPSGAIVINAAGASVCDICSNNSPTLTSGTPPTARNVQQWSADYVYDYQVLGGSLGLQANTNAANSGLDGFVCDDQMLTEPINGDWLRTGSSQNSPNSTVDTAIKSGQSSIVSNLRSRDATKLVIGNISQLLDFSASTAGLVGVYDGGVAEGCMGLSWSPETTGAGTSGWWYMMNYVARCMSFAGGAQVVLFNHANVNNNGEDYYRQSVPFQALRYGLGSCLMSNAYYDVDALGTGAFNNSYGNNNVNNIGPGCWFDEYAVNPTTLVTLKASYPNVSAGLGWMGDPIDPAYVQGASAYVAGTPAWQNGVYRRRFQMRSPNGSRQVWVMVNPKGNGTQTVTYGQRMQAFTGTQDTTVNSGNNNITSDSIPEQDCRIRITYP